MNYDLPAFGISKDMIWRVLQDFGCAKRVAKVYPFRSQAGSVHMEGFQKVFVWQLKFPWM